MNISARIEVIVEEIHFELTDLLQHVVGYYNDEDTRETITALITEYLYGFEETRSAIVICDESNNPSEVVDKGQLNIDALFVLDNFSFTGEFKIAPGINGYNPDISILFFQRKATVDAIPERNVFSIDVRSEIEFAIEKFLENIKASVENTSDVSLSGGAWQVKKTDDELEVGKFTGIDLEAEMSGAILSMNTPTYKEMPETLVRALGI